MLAHCWVCFGIRPDFGVLILFCNGASHLRVSVAMESFLIQVHVLM